MIYRGPITRREVVWLLVMAMVVATLFVFAADFPYV